MPLLPSRPFTLTEPVKAPADPLLVRPLIVASLAVGSVGFAPRFQYESDRISDIPVRTIGLEGTAPRFQVTTSVGIVADRHGAKNASVSVRSTPLMLDRFRIGGGARVDVSTDRYGLFQSGGARIAGTDSTRQFIGHVEVGLGGYHRSFLRMGAFYGFVASDDSLALYLGEQRISSPLDTTERERASFRGIQLSGAVRFWGISLEQTVTGYVTEIPTHALPSDCVSIQGTVSYRSPWRVGVYAKGARTLGLHTNVTSSLRSLNDSWSAGVTVQIP